jgi:hypothetical protein
MSSATGYQIDHSGCLLCTGPKRGVRPAAAAAGTACALRGRIPRRHGLLPLLLPRPPRHRLRRRSPGTRSPCDSLLVKPTVFDPHGNDLFLMGFPWSRIRWSARAGSVTPSWTTATPTQPVSFEFFCCADRIGFDV